MKQVIALTLMCLMTLASTAQEVSNIHFEQDGKTVKIYYDLSDNANIHIYISTDGGRTMLLLTFI